MKNLLLIGGSYPVCDRASQTGADVFWFQNRRMLDPASIAGVRFAGFLDYDDGALVREIAAALHKSVELAAVVSTMERGLRLAANIGADLEIPGMAAPHVVDTFQDKYRTRRALEAANFENVWSEEVSQRQECQKIIEDRNVSVILKPREGSGSDGVQLIQAGQTDFEFRPDTNYVVEEYLDGPEYSVECFSFNRKHVVLGVTAKVNYGESLMNPFLETGHVFPAPLDPSAFDLIKIYVCGLLDALDYQNGPSHTEIKLTSAGPRLIETHPRIAGDFLTELVRLTTGVDLTSLSFKWPLGLVDEGLPAIQYHGAAAVRYFGAEPGILRNIHGLDALRADRNVHHIRFNRMLGQSISHSMAETLRSRDRFGSVLCTGRTAAEAIAHCDRVIDSLAIKSMPDSQQIWSVN